MPILRTLDEEETEIFFHLVRNKGRTMNDVLDRSNLLLDNACSDEAKVKLAKMSEEENFALKNRYKFEKDTMAYADKSKMPVDSGKVKDVLRNSNTIKKKLTDEIENYFSHDVGPDMQMQNGLLTYVHEASWGDLKELLTDIGINKESIRFMNSQEWQGLREQDLWGETDNIKKMMNARYVLADMTDYENDFPSINEVAGFQVENKMAIQNLLQTWPQTDCRAVDIEEMEKFPALGTGSTHKGGVLDRIEAAEMESEEDEDEEEDDDDEDEDEEGEGDEEGGDDEGEGEDEEDEEEGEEKEDPLALPSPRVMAPPDESRYYMHDETMRESFNEVELDSFMKLLNVKPVPQWEENNTHHYKVGTHAYEDEA